LKKKASPLTAMGISRSPLAPETLEYLVQMRAFLATTFERRHIVIIIDGEDEDVSQTRKS
jgi:hypothetical protein